MLFSVAGVSRCALGSAGWVRLAALVPVLYLAAFVWENVMLAKPEPTRPGPGEPPSQLVATKYVNDTPSAGVQKWSLAVRRQCGERYFTWASAAADAVVPEDEDARVLPQVRLPESLGRQLLRVDERLVEP